MNRFRLSILCVLVFFSSLIIAQQNVNPIVIIDFMRVTNDHNGKYMDVEQKVWKPLHQAKVDQGELLGWYLFNVSFTGTDSEYQYATIRVYENMSKLDSPFDDMEEVFKKVHPGKDMEEAMEMTSGSRDLIYSHVLSGWEQFMDPSATAPPKVAQMVFFDTPEGEGGAYRDVEREVWHPMHKKEIELGKRVGWTGLTLQAPLGEVTPYDHIAVDMYKDWAQFSAPATEGLFKMVHPTAKWADVMDKTRKVQDVYKIEVWRMIDYVTANPAMAASGNE